MKRNLNVKERGKRPDDPTECNNLGDSEFYRSAIVREVVKKVSEIQNAQLGEFRIRDLNDEINLLLKDKRKWEDRIRELGGPDYALETSSISKGAITTGTGEDDTYLYFGEAKNLPQVKKLFHKEAP
jgi:pre-mRNA-splicing factor ISY1